MADGSGKAEAGGATSVEMGLLWSVLLLVVLAVVQVGLLSYAGQLAQTAAQDGVRSGRAFSVAATTDVARRDAEAFLARAGGSVLTDIEVTATVVDGGGILRVQVTGTALSLLPGLPLTVTRAAVGGVEQVAP